ncbi:MAG TPA: 2-oxo acid dehydrogenase subunit E2 [Myxococcota bacterium]|nr:2-oxo acid dehydrogenase subunit E2 [Myxococcota bacterium]
MPTEIFLTKVGMTMSEGVVAQWYVADGAAVEKGALLYRLETEKVELEVDADASGVVRHLVAENVTLAPGDLIGFIFAPGETIPADLSALAQSVPAGAPALVTEAAAPRPAGAGAAAAARAALGAGGRVLSSPAARRLARELQVDFSALAGTGPGGRIVEADIRAASNAVQRTPTAAASDVKASPLARKLAEELGVDLASVRGSGPNGRIVKDDVEAAAKAPRLRVVPIGAPIAPPAQRAGETIPLRGMRKTIATRMFESLRTTAQLTMDMDVRMDDAVRLREQLVAEWQSEGVKPSYTDLVVRAVTKALAQHPRMNSVLGEHEIALLPDVHVGIAVALEEGLVVPVIRDTAALSVKEIARESSRLAAAARDGKLSMDDFAGGTFTVSTLGMFGVDSFTPILNAPQTGILGVNRIRDEVGWEGERPVRRKAMRLSLTWDHRVLDGEPAARFLASVRDLLEAPYRLLA